jgi:hypothetical protein
MMAPSQAAAAIMRARGHAKHCACIRLRSAGGASQQGRDSIVRTHVSCDDGPKLTPLCLTECYASGGIALSYTS